jgi:hypothetical protein
MLANCLFAQTHEGNSIEYPTEFNNKQGNYLQYYTDQSDIFTNITPISMSLEQILYEDVIDLRTPLISGTITKRKRIERQSGIMSFFGELDGHSGSSVQLVQNDGFIHAYINVGTDQYRIETLDGTNYIFKVDQRFVPREGCFDLTENDGKPNPKSHTPAEEPKSRINYTCKIRVLVLYTTAYDNATADPRGSIQGYMDYTNDANNLSQVVEDVELCYVEKTNYTENSDMYVDRNRFRNNNDGFMDEVHSLRFIYEADLCHLMTNKAGHTGVAYTIDADNSADAFCLTNKGNAESIYTFAHEMGHLIGCRHDPYVDASLTPYIWGHGYIKMNVGSNNFRTMMSYGDQCSDAGQSCPRVLRWSNPNITYNGYVAGTTALNHNRRVWNDEDAEVLGFNQADVSETIDDADVNQADYGYITATSFIKTTGTVTIEGTDFDMVAPDYIELGNGFKVNNGTSLYMDTKQTVGSCP